MLAYGRSTIEKRRIAGVNFNDIVDQQHCYDPEGIHPFARMLRKNKSKQGDVPTVLSRILASRPVCNSASTDDGLETIYL